MQKNRTKKLSIIIPHYNSVDLLEKLIASIPAIEEIEIIVIDDNSTEGTEQLQRLTNFRAEQITLLYNEPGCNSAGRCRNIGLAHAKGEWLLFADADDFFLPGFYEKVSAFFESENDIVYFLPTSLNIDTGEPDSRHIRYTKLVRHFLKTGEWKEEVELRYHWEVPWSKLVRRELVVKNDIHFDLTMVANDIMFSMKSARAARKIDASDEIIYCVTRKAGTLTTVMSKERFYVRLNVMLNKYHYLKQCLPKEEWGILHLWGRSYIQLAKQYGLNSVERIRLYIRLIKEGVQIDNSKKWKAVYAVFSPNKA